MSHNTFGHLFRVTTFGESHGPALGAIVDGCPPGIAISEEDLQGDLDRRRPGSSRHTTKPSTRAQTMAVYSNGASVAGVAIRNACVMA